MKDHSELTDRSGLHKDGIRVICKLLASKHNFGKICNYIIRVYIPSYVLIICLQNISICSYV